MTEQRRKEIINELNQLIESFEPYEEQSPDGSVSTWVEEPTMYWLISTYTESGKNHEKVGGSWVRENVPELASLPD